MNNSINSETIDKIEWLNEEFHIQLNSILSEWKTNVWSRLDKRVQELTPYFSEFVNDPDPKISDLAKTGLDVISSASKQLKEE